MPKYRKKPVVVEAVQFDGKHAGNVLELCQGNAFTTMPPTGHYLYLKTPEGDIKVAPKEYVIKGVTGVFYTLKPDQFEATFEPVEG